jgi:hypothetical protein
MHVAVGDQLGSGLLHVRSWEGYGNRALLEREHDGYKTSFDVARGEPRVQRTLLWPGLETILAEFGDDFIRVEELCKPATGVVICRIHDTIEDESSDPVWM